MPKCKIEWCKRRVFSKHMGLCSPHYQQAYQDAKNRGVPIAQGKPRADTLLRGSLRGVATCSQPGCDRPSGTKRQGFASITIGGIVGIAILDVPSGPVTANARSLRMARFVRVNTRGMACVRCILIASASTQSDAAYRLSKAIL
jgi:hypothetical protein